ncbi:hypothetical protein CROQUDRAFT_37427 [Cronartium quercuum f. sp. fusiforme G11]|uniref:serine C-palmitoyltransferase n=1 Tax=Cronartium quercuum f. sp. fusiforme G11 TaxID=708437 RepID=A0A9P6NRG9_9BASI|nr:hypothetical protein CROQUDRAFT_37641 [Cronartium quercuum f. sp. fusiforme G11]KAG0150870.1 hypothetical protein CROQUDRAFT_37427 [Cronartium quercuum f. sp. fusiforme G11]
MLNSDSERDSDESLISTPSTNFTTQLTTTTEATTPANSPKYTQQFDLSPEPINSIQPNKGPGWKLALKQSKANVHSDQTLYDKSLHSSILAHQLPYRSFDNDPNFLPRPHDPHCLRHSEFGYASDEDECLWESKFRSDDIPEHENEDGGYFTYFTAYWSYLLVILIGHARDFFGKKFSPNSYAHLMPHNGYAALNSDFGSFFTRRIKSRLDDSFSRPVTGSAARTIQILDRTSSDNCITFKYTHTITQALNISSYNYLGFSQSRGLCTDSVEQTILNLGINSGGTREDVGSETSSIQAEKLISTFIGTESALLISQGFATNSTTFPALVSKGSLVISDELNHSSIRFGTRLSGAMVRTYKHNDMKDLERVLRESISQGQPRKLRGWDKILVVVEGIYSMEGTIVNLPALIELKKKYKFYIYLDEAHSIGALGPRGRGVCDYFGIDPSKIDILMGTLTKSFGASGGYVAGSKEIIEHLRRNCHSSVYAEALSPAVVAQIVSSMSLIMGRESQLNQLPICISSKVSIKLLEQVSEGELRLRRLAFNARYLHTGLRKLGFIVGGHQDSPIVPLLIFQPGKMLLFSRLMLQRYQIVVVIVGYPATPLVLGRVRFCVSAAHTKQDLDKILIATDDIGTSLGIKLGKSHKRLSIENVINSARELVAGGMSLDVWR